jgi:hypothetical protein
VNGQNLIIGAWLVAVGLVTIREIQGLEKTEPDPAARLPRPFVYLGSAVAFTILYALASPAPQLAATMAIGLDLGLLLNPYLKGTGAPLDAISNTLARIGGETVG